MYITVTTYLKLHATLARYLAKITCNFNRKESLCALAKITCNFNRKESLCALAKITCNFNRKNIFFNAKLIFKYECLLISNFYFKTKFMIDFSKYVYIRTKFC
jgi:hypothetical protein